MKKVILTTFLFWGSLQIGFTQCILNKQGWTQTFNEEFNTNITDLKTRWKILHNNPSGIASYPSIDQESNLTLNGGFAYFATQKLTTPITHDGKQYTHTTANIISKFDDIPFCSATNCSATNNANAGYLYGMFEIRCKLPKKAGQYIAYWLYGNCSWPPEIDVFEFNGTNHDNFFSTIHWGANNNPQSCGNTYYYPFNLTDDFHTWTVVWTPTKVTWFFDNKELKTEYVASHIPGATSPNMSERCKWIKMNQQIGSGLNYPNPSETTFEQLIVDYIKVYKPIGYSTYTTGDFDNWHDNIVKPLYQNTPFTFRCNQTPNSQVLTTTTATKFPSKSITSGWQNITNNHRVRTTFSYTITPIGQNLIGYSYCNEGDLIANQKVRLQATIKCEAQMKSLIGNTWAQTSAFKPDFEIDFNSFIFNYQIKSLITKQTVTESSTNIIENWSGNTNILQFSDLKFDNELNYFPRTQNFDQLEQNGWYSYPNHIYRIPNINDRTTVFFDTEVYLTNVHWFSQLPTLTGSIACRVKKGNNWISMGDITP